METALIALSALLGAAVIMLGILLIRARERAMQSEARLGDAQAAATAAQLRLGDLQTVLGETEKMRQEMSNAAKAAAFDVAQTLSSKLIEDHKRETAEAHAKAEARFKEVAQPLVDQVGKIQNAVAALNSQVEDKGRSLDTIQRALSSPSGAGAIAEIGLGNTLKAFGLEEGRDYMLQFATTSDAGRDLRPDAVVFLPGDTIVVIDSKASRFLLEIAEAADPDSEEQAYRSLAATMNGHLKALTSKNYQGAIQASWRASGRAREAARLFSIMYLPSESAIEKVTRADPAFRRKALDAGISVAGPDSLHFAISVAAVEIRGQRQAENQAEIVELTGQLLDSLRTVLDATAKVGRGIETAANSFADLARSVNGRLLPRARRLAKFGIETAKKLPANVPAIAVNRVETVIEGEAEELPAAAAPRQLSAE
jgi:DNA recombination protein RmuC